MCIRLVNWCNCITVAASLWLHVLAAYSANLFVISCRLVLVGTGIVKSEGTVKAVSRGGDR